MCKNKNELATILAQAGNHLDDKNAVALPLYLSSNYRHPTLEQARNYDPKKEYTYSRIATPNRQAVEKTMTQLEDGNAAFAVSSGMAAIQLALSFLKTGDHVISLDDLYGGDFRYFRYLQNHYGIDFSQWNGKSINELLAKITAKTRLIWLETPSNPMMKTLDIEKIAQAVHQKSPDVLLAVDNTFLTPVYQRPLELGADIVVHSATKYLSGHNDLLGGILVVKDPQLASQYYDYYITTGDTLASFDSWLLLRSLKTLKVRMKQHTANAKKIVEFLKQDSRVTKVLYPSQGGMVSFYLQNEQQVEAVLNNVKVITFAESLGGVESLITIPYYQTHADVAEEQRKRLGITPTLLRLSVGLEDPTDLINDLKQALDR